MVRKKSPPLSPRHKQLLEQGGMLEAAGRLREAEFCYQSVLRDVPNAPDALNAMGGLATRAGRTDLALGFFERALRVSPKDAALRNNLANCFIQLKRPEQALLHLKKAVALDPDLDAARINLGRALRHSGKAKEALNQYSLLMDRNPDFPGLALECGQAWLDLGDVSQAIPCLEEAIKKDPKDAEALAALVELGAPNGPDLLLTQVRDALGTETRRQYLGALHFAAGKLLESSGNYGEAFEDFRKGNEYLRGPSGLEWMKGFVSSCESGLSEDAFSTRTTGGHKSTRPVFIIGMPRSGTSLTEQILSRHSGVVGGGEMNAIETISRDLFGAAIPKPEDFCRRLLALPEKKLRAGAEKYLKSLSAVSRHAIHVTDKMPHNFLSVGLIALMFPQARFIDCRRNPLDTCLSCFTTRFNEGHGYAADLSNLGQYYGLYHRLVEHWHRVLPGRILRLDYETLVESPEAETRRVLGFLDLPWEPECLSFQDAERSVMTPSRLQVRKPLYSTSIGRWKNYAEHLEPLKRALGNLVAN